MEATINIGNNSYGFTKGLGKIELLKNTIELEGVSLKSRSLLLRGSLILLYVFLGVLIFSVFEWFLIITGMLREMMGDVGDLSNRRSDLPNLVFWLFVVILPFAGAFWSAGKLINPIRLRFSIPIRESISYGDLSGAKITADGKMELNALSRDDKTEKTLVMEFHDTSLYDTALDILKSNLIKIKGTPTH